MEEIWKDVIGYEGLYKISNLGRLKSLRCRGKLREKILSPALNTTGYPMACLSKNKTRKRWTIHRLVAMAFIPNPENKRTINHKDGNRANNHLDNLEWMTYSENHMHSYIVLGRKHPFATGEFWLREKLPKVNLKERKIKMLSMGGELLMAFPNIKTARTMLGLSKAPITNAARGKSNSSGGYKWEYFKKSA